MIYRKKGSRGARTSMDRWIKDQAKRDESLARLGLRLADRRVRVTRRNSSPRCRSRPPASRGSSPSFACSRKLGPPCSRSSSRPCAYCRDGDRHDVLVPVTPALARELMNMGADLDVVRAPKCGASDALRARTVEEPVTNPRSAGANAPGGTPDVSNQEVAAHGLPLRGATPFAVLRLQLEKVEEQVARCW